MSEFLIICPLVFIAGFIDAIAGGGGLISLPAYLMAGLPTHTAIGTNKFSSCMGTLVATYRYAQNGYIKIFNVIPSIITALIGSWLGAKIALFISADIFKVIILIIIPITAYSVIKAKSLECNKEHYSLIKTNIISSLISLGIGFYDGFYGPGTGTFLILLLVNVARVSLKEAAGTTKVINLSTNISALTVFIFNGVVAFHIGFVAALFGILGNYLGANFFIKNEKNFTKPIILIVLSIFFIKILYEYYLE